MLLSMLLPPPTVVEVVKLVEVVEVCSVVLAVHSPAYVILYLQCWSHICCSGYWVRSAVHLELYLQCASPHCWCQTVVAPTPEEVEVVEIVEVLEVYFVLVGGTQRGACCIIPTLCFATLLISNCTAPPHRRRSRSCGNNISCRSLFRFGSGTQRDACCIIATLCFASLLFSNSTVPPPPHPRRSRSCGNSRSCRSPHRFASGSKRCGRCIIPTLWFTTLLFSYSRPPPAP